MQTFQKTHRKREKKAAADGKKTRRRTRILEMRTRSRGDFRVRKPRHPKRVEVSPPLTFDDLGPEDQVDLLAPLTEFGQHRIHEMPGDYVLTRWKSQTHIIAGVPLKLHTNDGVIIRANLLKHSAPLLVPLRQIRELAAVLC